MNIDGGLYFGEVDTEKTKKDGRGIIIDLVKINIYEGWLQNNKRHGKGRLISKDGHIY